MSTTAIVKIDPKEYGVEESKAKEVEAAFLPMLKEMSKLEEEFNKVAKMELSEDKCKKARELRLTYVKTRTATATIHKQAKAFYLAGGKFVDGWKNAQSFASTGKEDELRLIEEHYENIEKQKKEAIKAERWGKLSPYMGEEPIGLDEMQEDVFINFLTGVKTAYNERLEAENKVKIAEIKKQKEEEEAKRKMEEENARLKKEAEELEAKQKKEEEARIAKEEEEQAIRDAEAKKKQEEHEAQIKKEQEAKDKLKATLEAKLAEETKRLEAEQKAIKDQEEEAEKAKCAPDKEKLEALSKAISSIEIPVLEGEGAKLVVNATKGLLVKTVAYLDAQINNF